MRKEKNMPAISVVMPVYNTKEYVGKAIQSILDQTFSDFEFLIIDNGSTDGSGDVIARYAQADSRIRVIHNEKNVFIAEARNRALELVQGEYLNLIDSDDWVLPDMLETMYSRAKKHDAQYVVAGYFMDYYVSGRNESYAVCPDDKDYEQKEFRENAIRYLTRTILTVPWNKLYSIPYLREHNIKFRNTKLEDHHFNMDILMDVERVSMVSKPFYHYYRSRQGTDSELVYNQFLNQKSEIILPTHWKSINTGEFRMLILWDSWLTIIWDVWYSVLCKLLPISRLQRKKNIRNYRRLLTIHIRNLQKEML